MVDIVLLILGCLLLLVGLAGAVVPVLPGPPLGYAGLLVLAWSGYADFSAGFLWLWAGITVVVTLADYLLPVWLTRRFGGSREASVGATLGVIAGLFLFPPVGLIVCPFLGAYIGQLSDHTTPREKALRVAFGSFIAFLLGTGAKLIVGAIMIVYAIRALL